MTNWKNLNRKHMLCGAILLNSKPAASSEGRPVVTRVYAVAADKLVLFKKHLYGFVTKSSAADGTDVCKIEVLPHPQLRPALPGAPEYFNGSFSQLVCSDDPCVVNQPTEVNVDPNYAVSPVIWQVVSFTVGHRDRGLEPKCLQNKPSGGVQLPANKSFESVRNTSLASHTPDKDYYFGGDCWIEVTVQYKLCDRQVPSNRTDQPLRPIIEPNARRGNGILGMLGNDPFSCLEYREQSRFEGRTIRNGTEFCKDDEGKIPDCCTTPGPDARFFEPVTTKNITLDWKRAYCPDFKKLDGLEGKTISNSFLGFPAFAVAFDSYEQTPKRDCFGVEYWDIKINLIVKTVAAKGEDGTNSPYTVLVPDDSGGPSEGQIEVCDKVGFWGRAYCTDPGGIIANTLQKWMMVCITDPCEITLSSMQVTDTPSSQVVQVSPFCWGKTFRICASPTNTELPLPSDLGDVVIGNGVGGVFGSIDIAPGQQNCIQFTIPVGTTLLSLDYTGFTLPPGQELLGSITINFASSLIKAINNQDLVFANCPAPDDIFCQQFTA